MFPGSARVFLAQECEMPASAEAADLQRQAREHTRRLRAWICALRLRRLELPGSFCAKLQGGDT